MDHKFKDGTKFWSQRETPTAIHLNTKESGHIDFIYYTSLLLAEALSIKPNKDKEFMINIIDGLKYPCFIPRRFKFIFSDT